jgi:hypothetical protein
MDITEAQRPLMENNKCVQDPYSVSGGAPLRRVVSSWSAKV